MTELHTYKILLVNDHEDSLLAWRTALEPLHVEMVAVPSGGEALRALLLDGFAVILMDVNMPLMDGLETAAIIRQRDRLAHIPIIFVTGVDLSGARLKAAYALGAIDYVYAPITAEVLRAKVDALLTLRRHSDRIQELERKEHERVLAAAQDRIEAEEKRNRFFTLSLDLLGIMGFDGYLKQVNPSWQRCLGYSREELLSQPLSSFLHVEDQAAAQYIDGLAAGRTWRDSEVRMRTSDGSYRWLLCNAVPYAEEQLSYIAARDITDRKAAQSLAEREARLDAANNELRAFSYSVAHDLRAPLRGIEGFSAILMEEEGEGLTPEGRARLEQIRASVGKMAQLIDDLLSLSRVGFCEVDIGPVDLGLVVRECLAGLRSASPERQVDVHIGEGLQVTGDRSLLHLALQNLIENAWKFTGKCSTSRIEVERMEADGEAIFFVRDNGAGFDMQYVNKLFQAFQRLHRGDEYPGTGIGLAIVRRVIERHNGRVWAESGVGRGTTVYFTLPNASSQNGMLPAGLIGDPSLQRQATQEDPNHDAEQPVEREGGQQGQGAITG